MILQIEPTNVLVLTYKGDALMELERYEEAISYFDMILQIEPTNVLALTHKGVALGDLERYEEAISYFDMILYIDPTNVVAQENSKITFEKIGTVLADNSKYYAYVQIQLLNSADELIAYIESDAIFYLPHQLTDEFVESFPVMKTVERNGKVFEFREIILTNQVDKDTGFAITEISLTISGVSISVFKAFTHDYIVSSDDTVITSWKIMKSVTD